SIVSGNIQRRHSIPRLSVAIHLHVDVCLGLQQQLDHRLIPFPERNVYRRLSISSLSLASHLPFDICLVVHQRLHHRLIPFPDAMCGAVLPLSFFTLTSAQASSSSLTTASCPPATG